MSPEIEKVTGEWEFRNKKLAQSRDLIAATFDLLNDNISAEQWLAMIAETANCGRVTCLWWRAGQPGSILKESSAEHLDVSANWVERVEQLLSITNPDEPAVLGALMDKAGWIDQPHDPLLCPDRLVTCLDWAPARVILIYGDRYDSPNWDQNDADNTLKLAPILHKSIAVKKRLSWQDDMIELSNKIFDAIPHGFITLMPDGKILVADESSRTLLDDGAYISDKKGGVILCDATMQRELANKLQEIRNLPIDQLQDFIWHKNLSGTTGPGSLMLAMRAFSLDLWKRESTEFDRVAVMMLQTHDARAIPSASQLQEFLQITKAQARIVNTLMQGASIEDTAARLNVSINTVRTHLRSIYAKLGVTNKAQLMQMVASTMTGRAN